MKSYNAGKYIPHKGYKPFLPSLINDVDIDWKLTELSTLIQEASLYLGKLNSYAELIPDIDFFIKMYATKEATNSNRIEGTQTTFDDAISPVEQVAPGSRNDWHEVQNYIQAINYCIEKLKELPVSLRLIKEAHRILMQGVRGEHKTPGEIRKTQNWIGGSSLKDAFFIPPEPNILPDLLTDVEKFLHNEDLQVPEIVKAGILHYQFETIHPFLDGNGRSGRLLIILYLISTGLLNKPVLYISDFFERNRMSYYDSLAMVKKSNDITQWLKFFLNGIVETSKSSIKAFDEVIELKKDIEKKLSHIGKKASNGQKLVELLYSQPKVNAKTVAKELGISVVSANKLLKTFVDIGILEEKTGFNRNRYYMFEDYIKIFR
jgi:Fic family protein